MPDKLPTPRTMAGTGLRLHVWCKACRHAKDVDLIALIDAGRGDVPLVNLRWRCAQCGHRRIGMDLHVEGRVRPW